MQVGESLGFDLPARADRKTDFGDCSEPVVQEPASDPYGQSAARVCQFQGRAILHTVQDVVDQPYQHANPLPALAQLRAGLPAHPALHSD